MIIISYIICTICYHYHHNVANLLLGGPLPPQLCDLGGDVLARYGDSSLSLSLTISLSLSIYIYIYIHVYIYIYHYSYYNH